MYLCPVSCAIVNATPRPVSSLIVQLPVGEHIPPIWANPNEIVTIDTSINLIISLPNLMRHVTDTDNSKPT